MSSHTKADWAELPDWTKLPAPVDDGAAAHLQVYFLAF